jgi:hypothetical protein
VVVWLCLWERHNDPIGLRRPGRGASGLSDEISGSVLLWLCPKRERCRGGGVSCTLGRHYFSSCFLGHFIVVFFLSLLFFILALWATHFTFFQPPTTHSSNWSSSLSAGAGPPISSITLLLKPSKRLSSTLIHAPSIARLYLCHCIRVDPPQSCDCITNPPHALR